MTDCRRGSNPTQGIAYHWCMVHDAEFLLSVTRCAAASEPPVETDEEWAAANGLPVLRLTGEQIGSIEPPLGADWFIDFDEYELYVPLRILRAARGTTK